MDSAAQAIWDDIAGTDISTMRDPKAPFSKKLDAFTDLAASIVEPAKEAPTIAAKAAVKAGADAAKGAAAGSAVHLVKDAAVDAVEKNSVGPAEASKTKHKDRNEGVAEDLQAKNQRSELIKNGDATDKATIAALDKAGKPWIGHHLIPLDQVKRHPELFEKASQVEGGFKTDEAANLAALPKTKEGQNILKEHGIDRPIHDSAHQKTRDDVEERLGRIEQQLENEDLKQESPEFAKRANELIRNLERDLRGELSGQQRLTDNVAPATTRHTA